MKVFTASALLALATAAAPADAGAQAPPPDAASLDRSAPETYVINVRDVELAEFAEQVSALTGRTLILDPSVRGTVTVISAEPLGEEGVWALFQSVLRVNGYAALPAGTGWRIVPQSQVRQAGVPMIESGARPPAQDLVTRLVPLRNIGADAAARTLAPMAASFGAVQAIESPNAIVITDYAETVERIETLALELDSGDGERLETVPVRFADATELAASIDRVMSGSSRPGRAPRIAVDARSNTLLVRGSPDALREVVNLVGALDQPGGSAASVTRVMRLRHGDAETIAQILQGVLTGRAGGAPVNPVARSAAESLSAGQNPDDLAQRILGRSQPSAERGGGEGRGEETRSGDALQAAAFEDVSIFPASDMNAVVARGPAAAIAEIDALVAELDVRRPQVLIEAAIVEITGDGAEQLGIQLGFAGAARRGGVAATSFSDAGVSLRSILATLGAPAAIGLAESGLTIGAGGNDFSVLVQALSQTTSANLLSTPSITTLDNQIAEIVVGQNVPFRTGSFSTSGNTTNPFTTIQRQDVGITLRVAPRIHEGDVIRLDVSQEVSSLVAASLAGAADLITNRRSIQTTVLADDGETIVLGGLITDDSQSQTGEVPGLGRIPVVGRAFRSEQQTRTKRTLFVFLRPTILRDGADVAAASRERYDRLTAASAEPEDMQMLFRRPEQHLPDILDELY
jgi:general secretion pathway protein D